MAVASYSVRTLALKGENGYGQDELVLAKVQQLDSKLVGIQETSRGCGKTIRDAGYQCCCSGRVKLAARQELY